MRQRNSNRVPITTLILERTKTQLFNLSLFCSGMLPRDESSKECWKGLCSLECSISLTLKRIMGVKSTGGLSRPNVIPILSLKVYSEWDSLLSISCHFQRYLRIPTSNYNQKFINLKSAHCEKSSPN